MKLFEPFTPELIGTSCALRYRVWYMYMVGVEFLFLITSSVFFNVLNFKSSTCFKSINRCLLL